MSIGGIKITYVLPELITNNITKKSLGDFVKDLDEEDYIYGCDLNKYISKLINQFRYIYSFLDSQTINLKLKQMYIKLSILLIKGIHIVNT